MREEALSISAGWAKSWWKREGRRLAGWNHALFRHHSDGVQPLGQNTQKVPQHTWKAHMGTVFDCIQSQRSDVIEEFQLKSGEDRQNFCRCKVCQLALLLLARFANSPKIKIQDHKEIWPQYCVKNTIGPYKIHRFTSQMRSKENHPQTCSCYNICWWFHPMQNSAYNNTVVWRR